MTNTKFVECSSDFDDLRCHPVNKTVSLNGCCSHISSVADPSVVFFVLSHSFEAAAKRNNKYASSYSKCTRTITNYKNNNNNNKMAMLSHPICNRFQWFAHSDRIKVTRQHKNCAGSWTMYVHAFILDRVWFNVLYRIHTLIVFSCNSLSCVTETTIVVGSSNSSNNTEIICNLWFSAIWLRSSWPTMRGR